MERRVGSGLDAPMVAVDRFVSADLCILEAVGLLLCGEKLDVLAKSALVAFECENVVGLLGQDFRCDVALAAHSIDSHDSAFDRQHLEQRRDRDDFVGLLRHLDLPKHRWRAANAETIWIASCAPFFDRRDVLPSMAITSDGMPVSPATHATKHRWNCSASSVARMSPRWSWEGVPSPNGRNRRNSSIFFSPNRAMSVIASDPASTARRHRNNTSSSGYSTLPRCRGSGKSLKWSRKTMASPSAPVSPAVRSITIPRDANQRITTDSALQPIVTLFFTRSHCSPNEQVWTCAAP